MNAETRLVLRYVDREMSAAEAERFRARLLTSPDLCRQVQEMQELGVLLRRWSSTVEVRAEQLLEPTLRRVRQAELRRPRHLWLSYGLLVLLLLAARASASLDALPELRPKLAHASLGAAIMRVDAAPQAQVFVVGASATPVVWLADDAQEDEGQSERDPG